MRSATAIRIRTAGVAISSDEAAWRMRDRQRASSARTRCTISPQHENELTAEHATVVCTHPGIAVFEIVRTHPAKLL